jgi:hypothetical protein
MPTQIMQQQQRYPLRQRQLSINHVYCNSSLQSNRNISRESTIRKTRKGNDSHVQNDNKPLKMIMFILDSKHNDTTPKISDHHHTKRSILETTKSAADW